jgi:hypothetical protein
MSHLVVEKIIHRYSFTVGVILLLTAIAKFISASGNAHILNSHDPSLGIQYNHLLLIAAICELFVSIVCLLSRHTFMKVTLIAWLSTIFAIYRFTVFWLNVPKPCPCLGTLTEALHISPQTANTTMEIILVYLFVGSYAALFWLWCQKKCH